MNINTYTKKELYELFLTERMLASSAQEKLGECQEAVANYHDWKDGVFELFQMINDDLDGEHCPSVGSAIQCAASILKDMAERNKNLANKNSTQAQTIENQTKLLDQLYKESRKRASTIVSIANRLSETDGPLV